MNEIKGNYTRNNSDNLTEAVHGLDIFTKNWCMNCKETEKQNDLVFRCSECEFGKGRDFCAVKEFAHNPHRRHDYDMDSFGSMIH